MAVTVPLPTPNCITYSVIHDASAVQATMSGPVSLLEWQPVRGLVQGVIITHSIVKACIAATKSHLSHLDDVDDISETDVFLSFLPLAHIMLSLSSSNTWRYMFSFCDMNGAHADGWRQTRFSGDCACCRTGQRRSPSCTPVARLGTTGVLMLSRKQILACTVRPHPMTA